MYLVIDLMQAATGNRPAQFSGGALLSDVLTIVTTGGVCSQTNPCQTIFDDFGQVVLRTPLKDITNPSSPNAPTTNNEVTINRYRVVYRRTDGRNTQGVDVPYAFDGGVTGTVPLGGTLTLAFELVRHVAKVEPPLAQLRSNGGVIYTIADVTFFAAFPWGAAYAAAAETMPNPLRAQGTALYVLVINLVSGALGATAVALVTDRVFGEDQALRYSLSIVSAIGMLLAGSLLALGLRPYRRTVEGRRQRAEGRDER